MKRTETRTPTPTTLKNESNIRRFIPLSHRHRLPFAIDENRHLRELNAELFQFDGIPHRSIVNSFL